MVIFLARFMILFINRCNFCIFHSSGKSRSWQRVIEIMIQKIRNNISILFSLTIFTGISVFWETIQLFNDFLYCTKWYWLVQSDIDWYKVILTLKVWISRSSISSVITFIPGCFLYFVMPYPLPRVGRVETKIRFFANTCYSFF